MITLSQRIKKQKEQQTTTNNRISIRDRLLTREVQEMAQLLPSHCSVTYENANDLSSFVLTIKPKKGYWQGGIFKFSINVTEDYNMVPPKVKCLTRLWHPNISETGEVCLSILRPHSLDGSGWSPTRRLYDVVFGLNLLFSDLLNFDDPLNIDAADMYFDSKEVFSKKVSEYINLYSKE